MGCRWVHEGEVLSLGVKARVRVTQNAKDFQMRLLRTSQPMNEELTIDMAFEAFNKEQWIISMKILF